MKKLYLATLFFVAFFVQTTSAQLVANDDVAYINNSGFAMLGSNYFNVRNNDTYDGAPFQAGFVNLSQVSSSSPLISVSGGLIYAQAGIPAGTYTLVYQICQSSNLSNCDTATVTVYVCSQPNPTMNITQPDCSNPNGSVMFSGLPSGNWTILKRTYSTSFVATNGTGPTFTFSNLTPNYYYFKVVNDTGCTSSETSADINIPDGMDVTPVGVYQDANGNGITDPGDIVNWHLDIVNSFPCPLTNVDTLYTSIELHGAPILSIPGNTTDSSINGVEVLTQDDINNGQASIYAWVSADSGAGPQYGKYMGTLTLNINDRIRFDAFIDTNGNGIHDGGEVNYNDGTFYYERNNDGTVHNIESDTGTYTLYETNPTNTYTVGYDMYTNCSVSYTVSPSVYNNLTIPTGSGLTMLPFPITIVPCIDLEVYVERRETARPGQTYSHWVEYYNAGNQPVSGTISFTCDPAVTVTAVSNPGAIVTTSGFTFNVGNLQPGEWDYFYVTMQTPPSPTVSLGDLLTSAISITIPPGDSDPSNNAMSITEEVTNSYDPNDISERHGPRILFSTFTAQDYLTYSIRFENTGNADAINIRIADLLSTKLDPTTARMVGASHSYVLDRVGNNLEWTFSGIGLPPSVDATDTGKGFLVFEVKPKAGYAVGDIIPNTASIFFDSNPAIITNTFTTEFVASMAAPEFAQGEVRLYPNPAKSIVNISLADAAMIESIVVIDISGKLVMAEMPQAANAALNISGLAKGLYFAKITSGDKEKTVKVIKE